MSNLARVYSMTADDYLAGETHSPIRHQYVAGEVFAMAGATEEHATIALNFAALLRNQVRGGPCRVYIADMKLRVEAADAFFYPDVFVTCDPRDATNPLAKRHPALICEVLSESTEAYDRGGKLAAYRTLESLADKFDQWAEDYKREGETLVLQRLLARRFGPLPSEVITRISGASIEEVEIWCDRLLDATSLVEVLRP